ncbi:hypothetical protein V1512DRAFT_257640 [Lipomyces arxii]|uniref:uncharacterized protein n=1 Tax=Lipomyces arxii TaxID=56418 RepID=UPI0034CE9E2E
MRFSSAVVFSLFGLIGLGFSEETTIESSPKFVLSTKFASGDGLPVVINAVPTSVMISVVNEEDEDAIIQVAGGALFEVGKEETAIENITAIRVGPIDVTAHGEKSIEYEFKIDREPKEYFLRIGLLIEYQNNLVQYLGYNSTIIVQDAAISFFDPQLLFLYIILSGFFGGLGYFVYNSYLKSYIVKKPASKKRTVKSATSPEPAVSSATGASATTYDESWIPEHHLRSKSPKPIKGSKKAKKITK